MPSLKKEVLKIHIAYLALMFSPCSVLIFSSNLRVFKHIIVNTGSFCTTHLLLFHYDPSTVSFILKENMIFVLNFEMCISK